MVIEHERLNFNFLLLLILEITFNLIRTKVNFNLQKLKCICFSNSSFIITDYEVVVVQWEELFSRSILEIFINIILLIFYNFYFFISFSPAVQILSVKKESNYFLIHFNFSLTRIPSHMQIY